MSLEQVTAEWDGKSADEIRRTFEQYRQENNYINSLIQVIEFPKAQRGATWQLKAFLEHDGAISAQEINQIYKLIPQLDHWESRLHILQSMPHMPITADNVPAVELFLRNGLQDNNKFVRAWSYNGMYLLGQQFPEFAAEVDVLLQDALVNEAPSVRSRIRNILKKK